MQQCREIFLRQLSCAIEELEGDKPNVHGARKQLKRARATLRLLRPAIDDDLYSRENIAARDAARPLSSVRDHDVQCEVLDSLLEGFGPSAADLHVAPLRQSLQNSRKRGAQELPVKRLTEIGAALKRSTTRARAWPLDTDGWDCIARGLRTTYRRARRALRHARTDRATDDLHEWRKQTKYLWHQLQILTPLAAGPVGELADEFHHLADYLGDEHDLAVLREQVTASNGMSEAACGALRTLIERRRDELQGKALTLGERLYADKSKAFVHALAKHWSDWERRESHASGKHHAAEQPDLRR